MSKITAELTSFYREIKGSFRIFSGSTTSKFLRNFVTKDTAKTKIHEAYSLFMYVVKDKMLCGLYPEIFDLLLISNSSLCGTRIMLHLFLFSYVFVCVGNVE